MNKEYIKALSIIENSLKDINRIYDKAEYKEFEDIKACQAMEKLIEYMESFIGEIKHYSKDTTEGYLNISPNGRYNIRSTELTCSHPIEIYNTEYQEWKAGRVEHSSRYGGYYFYNYDGNHQPLFNGMKARIRS